ncbi:hypothetical protein CCH79_00018462 [Gambusia affinis]|uniref:Uncharacterized protein n=1 Tax=Gambusia affinis TaxID=33528 RepID=A0A315UVF9_GAMAF|nr:hypothetical protein CCH79_00018462 [Gambusia affinis]
MSQRRRRDRSPEERTDSLDLPLFFFSSYFCVLLSDSRCRSVCSLLQPDGRWVCCSAFSRL